jgi:hypothetical protein
VYHLSLDERRQKAPPQRHVTLVHVRHESARVVEGIRLNDLERSRLTTFRASGFHGRGFCTTGISLSDTLARLAAGEAISGPLIEITFIATFTQRFFA